MTVLAKKNCTPTLNDLLPTLQIIMNYYVSLRMLPKTPHPNRRGDNDAGTKYIHIVFYAQ